MRRNIIVAVLLIIFISLGVSSIVKNNNKIELKTIELKDTGVQLKQLEQKYDQQLKKTDVNQDEIKKLQQEKQDLEKQVQAKAEEKQRLADLQVTQKVYAASYSQPVSAVVAGCGDNSYSQYIYQHESGCNLNSVNSIGCRGIGQACPGNKLPCGASYACQNAFFTDYANTRYGGWAGAYAWWLQNHWW